MALTSASKASGAGAAPPRAPLAATPPAAVRAPPPGAATPPAAGRPSDAAACAKSKSYSSPVLPLADSSTANCASSAAACSGATANLSSSAASDARDVSGWQLSNSAVQSRPTPSDSAKGPPGWDLMKSVTSSHRPCTFMTAREGGADLAPATTSHRVGGRFCTTTAASVCARGAIGGGVNLGGTGGAQSARGYARAGAASDARG